MAKQIINIGTSPNARDGDTLRSAFAKINNNFDEVYNNVSILLGGSPSEITGTFKGSLLANNGTLLVDAESGKITTAAIPLNVPLIYKFKAYFSGVGNLDSIVELPPYWSYTKSDNVATINHNVGRPPAIISYWGYSLTEGLRLRYPTPGYQAKANTTSPYSFNLNLNTAITGADDGNYAIITVLF